MVCCVLKVVSSLHLKVSSEKESRAEVGGNSHLI